MKREAIKEQQLRAGRHELAELKDRNTVSIEEYRRLSNELLRVQIEIVKVEAQLAQLQDERPPAAPGDVPPAVVEHDLAALFYADPRVAEVRVRLQGATDLYNESRKKVGDLRDPTLEKLLTVKRDAQAQLNALWTRMKPELEAAIRRGEAPPAPDPGLRTLVASLVALKAQEASVTHRLNTINVRQKADGVLAVGLEFDRLDLNRAEQYLDTISKNLATLEFQQLGEGISRRAGTGPEFKGVSELRIWDAASGEETRGVVEPGPWIGALAFTRDGKTLIAGGGVSGTPGFVTLWDLAPGPFPAPASPPAPF